MRRVDKSNNVQPPAIGRTGRFAGVLGLGLARDRAANASALVQASHPWARPAACGLAMAVAAWVTASAAGSMIKAASFRSWASTPGVVLLSEVRPCGDGSFAPAVRYRFDFGGSVALGERIAPGEPPCGSRSWAERQAARWKVDQQVDVRFESTRPGGSLLDTGSSIAGSAIELAVALLAFTAAAFGMLTPALRRRRLRTASPTP